MIWLLPLPRRTCTSCTSPVSLAHDHLICLTELVCTAADVRVMRFPGTPVGPSTAIESGGRVEAPPGTSAGGSASASTVSGKPGAETPSAIAMTGAPPLYPRIPAVAARPGRRNTKHGQDPRFALRRSRRIRSLHLLTPADPCRGAGRTRARFRRKGRCRPGPRTSACPRSPQQIHGSRDSPG